jgi:hypothetical protein
MAGATLSDCLAAGAARLEGDRLVPARTIGPVGPLIQHALARLGSRGARVDRAIEVLAAPRSRLGQHLLQAMTADGSAVDVDRRLLGALSLRFFAVADTAKAEALRARVAAALLGPVEDARVTALASLVIAGGLYRLVHLGPATVPLRRARPVLAPDPIVTAVAETIRRARRGGRHRRSGRGVRRLTGCPGSVGHTGAGRQPSNGASPQSNSSGPWRPAPPNEPPTSAPPDHGRHGPVAPKRPPGQTPATTVADVPAPVRLTLVEDDMGWTTAWGWPVQATHRTLVAK